MILLLFRVHRTIFWFELLLQLRCSWVTALSYKKYAQYFNTMREIENSMSQNSLLQRHKNIKLKCRTRLPGQNMGLKICLGLVYFLFRIRLIAFWSGVSTSLQTIVLDVTLQKYAVKHAVLISKEKVIPNVVNRRNFNSFLV